MSSSTPEESILYGALKFADTDARSDYISRACGSNTQLRQRVEGLVSAYGEGEFLESPIADVAATALLPPIGEKPGDTISSYKLLEQIGEGGMGLVFMAEQTRPLRRRVALKIIKPGLDTRAVIARFEAERQALALMDHPNIARVYDAGATESGRPFFVMELVRGAPITEYCQQRNVPLRERLNLFIEVCGAVQHAHQKGIIHRDLKPTNILVAQNDTNPVPKVIDFGVAKATIQPLTDRTLFTHFTQIIGTPLYMSPEQADLGNQDIDTRSDVYSLGVVLYELLTGTTPFDAERLRAGADEMRRILREEEPPKPSTRATTDAAALSTVAAKPQPSRLVEISALKGDLDWIVMKALEKDRRRRYESPSALAADIVRHINNEPIDAYPPTRRYRIVKFARRNRIALLTGGAIAAAILLGLSASIWQAVLARDAERRASQALEKAEARLKVARQAVDEMYLQASEKLFSKGDLTPVQREFLKKAVALYQGFAAENPDSPQARLDVANAQRRQAEILQQLGDVAGAESALRDSIGQLEAALPGLADPASGRFELAKSLEQLGGIHWMARNYEEAIPLFKRSLSELEKLVASHPTDQGFREYLGRSNDSLGNCFSEQGQHEDTQGYYRRSRDLFAELHKDSPERPWFMTLLAIAEGRLANVLRHSGRVEEAKAGFLRAIELHRKAVTKDPGDRNKSYYLACALIEASAENAVEDGLKADQEAFEILRGLVEDYPEMPDYLEMLVVAQRNYCISLNEHKRFADMLPVARSAVESARKLVKYPGKPDYRGQFVGAVQMLHYALLVNDLQQEAEAVRLEGMQQVRNDPAYRKYLGKQLKELAGDLYLKGRQSREAIELMEESIAAQPNEAGPSSWIVLALAHARLGDMETAKTWLEKALPLRKSEIRDEAFDEAVEVFQLPADSISSK